MVVCVAGSDKVPDMPSVRWHIGDVVQKLMDQAGLKQATLADRSGVGRNTIGSLLGGDVSSDPATIEKVAIALGTSRMALEQYANRLNGEDNVLPMPRTNLKEREEDRDPEISEAVQYGRRIARLPRLARLVIFNTVQAFEDAYHLTRPRVS